MKKLTTFLLVLSFAKQLLSQTCFEYSAIACVPRETAINTKAYSQTHGKVYHNGNSIQPITLFGPVFMPTDNGSSTDGDLLLSFTYRDPDGTGIQSRAAMALKSVNKKTGSVEQLDGLDSNSGSIPGVNTISGIITHQLDFNKFYYFVQIEIQRTTVNFIPEVYGYSICWYVR